MELVLSVQELVEDLKEHDVCAFAFYDVVVVQRNKNQLLVLTSRKKEHDVCAFPFYDVVVVQPNHQEEWWDLQKIDLKALNHEVMRMVSDLK